MKLYNILGQEVATLVNTPLFSGRYTVDFNGSGFANGIYIYQLEVNGFVESKKMVLA